MNITAFLCRRALGAVSAIALATVPFAVAKPASAAQPQITVIGNSWVGFAPIYVAEDMGYYKKLGINVVMTQDESKSDALAALERGSLIRR